MGDTIVSIDVETVGLIPGVHSIISLGAVAFVDRKEHDDFYRCIEELPDLTRLPSTMEWWKQFNDKYQDIVVRQARPENAIDDFGYWIESLPKPVVLAADPIAFDGAFVYYYCFRFLGPERFERTFPRCKGIDIKTVLMAALDKEYSKVNRLCIPGSWTDGLVVNHNALDDARQQGHVLMNALNYLETA
jgi:DNA polymerase III epsilon subunit-like protein